MTPWKSAYNGHTQSMIGRLVYMRKELAAYKLGELAERAAAVILLAQEATMEAPIPYHIVKEQFVTDCAA